MKTKIIISSSSGVEYIGSPHSISSMHDVIRYSKDEEYFDYVEAMPEVFYNRFKMDVGNPPVIRPCSDDAIKRLIELAIEGEYEQILFILPPIAFVDYSSVIEVIMKDYEIPYFIYKATVTAYPLAYLAIEADTRLKAGEDIYTVVKYLDSIAECSNVYLLSPKNDLLSSINRISLDDDILDFDKNGSVYKIEMGDAIEVKLEKKISPLYQMIKMYLSEIENVISMPFILYSSKLSAYIKYLESVLLKVYPKLKKIRCIAIPPSLGIKIGCNAIGIGYIKKIEE